MTVIDKDLVKKSFGAQAEKYDTLANVQKTVGDKLINLIKSSSVTPARLLDVGCGTGRLIEQIGELYPSARLTGIDLAFGMAKSAKSRKTGRRCSDFVCGDAENLPFRENSFDLAVSTSTYQWIHPLDDAFSEVYRTLEAGSRFIFALFGEKTLFELKESYGKALGESGKEAENRTHRFAPLTEVTEALSGAGFTQVRVFDELEYEIHPDVPSLIRSLKGIGAGNAAKRSSNGLSGRAEMLRMMDLYRSQFGTDAGIRATYHVLYGTGVK